MQPVGLMIVMKIAVDLFNNEFENCIKNSESTYPFCSVEGVDPQMTED